MLVLVTYDVNVQTKEGRKRLAKVAKCCLRYGQRVQNSVFECSIDVSQYRHFSQELIDLIDVEHDSLRFYNLGNHYIDRITHIGIKSSYDPEGVIMV